jgi:hypothetical protein
MSRALSRDSQSRSRNLIADRGADSFVQSIKQIAATVQAQGLELIAVKCDSSSVADSATTKARVLDETGVIIETISAPQSRTRWPSPGFVETTQQFSLLKNH